MFIFPIISSLWNLLSFYAQLNSIWKLISRAQVNSITQLYLWKSWNTNWGNLLVDQEVFYVIYVLLVLCKW